MYVARPLSTHKNKSNYAFSKPICEEPNSGCLFLQDDQEVEISSCVGFRHSLIKTLPFPQNASLTIYPGGDDYSYNLFFVPVFNKPISSNLYYIMRKYDGEALSCATLEDKQSCCFCFTTIPDEDPLPLDPEDIYQQFKISPSKHCQGFFSATSVAADGVVPSILRNEFEVQCNRVLASLVEVKGIDSAIRDHLPKMNFPLSSMHSESMVVGKWYCPFMFIKDDVPMKEQVKRSLFYKVTLERRWERIFTCQNSHGVAEKIVDMDVEITTEGITYGGKKMMSSMIVERMIWEEERVGWVRGDGKVRIKRVEEYEGEGLWDRFGCFVLVERFVVKRMDGSLVLEYDFKHSHQVKIMWERPMKFQCPNFV